MLVTEFEEIGAGMIVLFKSGQLFRHKFTQKFPLLKVFGAHKGRPFIPNPQPRSGILHRVIARKYVVVISLNPGCRIPEYPIIGIPCLLRHLNLNRFRPVLQMLIRSLDVGRTTTKYADKDNFLAIFRDNRSACTTTAAAQGTVPHAAASEQGRYS